DTGDVHVHNLNCWFAVSEPEQLSWEAYRMSDERRARERGGGKEIKQDLERLEKDVEKLEEIERERYKLIVNKKEHDGPEHLIKGRQILELAGSAPDWGANPLGSGG